MTTRVDLPSGNFVELNDPHTLKTKQVKKILSTISDSDKDIQSSFEVIEALANELITNWGFGQPIPSQPPFFTTEDVMDDYADYKALTAALQPAVNMLKGVSPDVSEHRDPASPTPPSNA